jgi:hypothetical protein
MGGGRADLAFPAYLPFHLKPPPLPLSDTHAHTHTPNKTIKTKQNKTKQVLRLLEQSKSSYCATFSRLAKEVFTSRLEANDNSKYLRTLEAR